MKNLVAFDLDGTLAESKQPLAPEMADALADLLQVADVAVISGGDWPQFDRQVASRLPARADLFRLWLMPTTGTKLYTHRDGAWNAVYAELFDEEQKRAILEAFDASLEATGFVPEQTWGDRIEDRGSQITFSALGQEAPINAKEIWDPDLPNAKSSRPTCERACLVCRSTWAARPRSTSRGRVSTRAMASKNSPKRAAFRSTQCSSSATRYSRAAMIIPLKNWGSIRSAYAIRPRRWP
jgi:HAD superfamily hydrolase (TIGR01484 family)